MRDHRWDVWGGETLLCVWKLKVITLEGERWCLGFVFNNDENLQLCNSSQFTKVLSHTLAYLHRLVDEEAEA